MENTGILDKFKAQHKEVEIYEFEEKGSVLNFSDPTNPFGIPFNLKWNIIKSLEMAKFYPPNDFYDTREEIATYHEVNIENVLVGSGATEFIYLCVQAMHPRRAVVVAPSCQAYEMACAGVGCEVTRFLTLCEENYQLNMDKFIEKIPYGTEMIIINNPNNPTGQLLEIPQMVTLCKFCRTRGIYLIVDESFADFAKEDISLCGEITNFANLIVIRSLSHFYSIPGFRIGYALAQKDVLAMLEKNRPPKTENVFTTISCRNLFTDRKYLINTVNWLETEPDYFYNELKKIENIIVYPSSVNFFLVKLLDINAAKVCDRLRRRKIFVKNCSEFPGLGDNYLRICVRSRKENNKFLTVFKRAVAAINIDKKPQKTAENHSKFEDKETVENIL